MNSGDENFRSMYKHYLPILKIIAAKKVPQDEVEDIVQDVFVSYFLNYSDKPEDEVGPLLVKMTYHRCADYNRKRLAHPVTFYDPTQSWEDTYLPEDMYDKDNLSVVLEKQEYQEALEILALMKKDWSQIFLLHVVEEKPMSEVSKILKISEGACRTRLCRGRQFLSEHFQTRENLKREAERQSIIKKKSEREISRTNLAYTSKLLGGT